MCGLMWVFCEWTNKIKARKFVSQQPLTIVISSRKAFFRKVGVNVVLEIYQLIITLIYIHTHLMRNNMFNK